MAWLANRPSFLGTPVPGWCTLAVVATAEFGRTIDHPHVGTLTLDCDVLTVSGSDLRVVVDTAEPGTEDAERLALVTVLGTQTPVE